MRHKRRELGWTAEGVCTMCGQITRCRCFHPAKPRTGDVNEIAAKLTTVMRKRRPMTLGEIAKALWAEPVATSQCIMDAVTAGKVKYETISNAGWTLPAFVLV